MTLDEAREQLISGIDHTAYRETDSSLHNSDKNRLFGSEHYKSGRPVYNLVRGPKGILKIRWLPFCAWQITCTVLFQRLKKHSDFLKKKNQSWAELSDERTAMKPDGSIPGPTLPIRPFTET